MTPTSVMPLAVLMVPGWAPKAHRGSLIMQHVADCMSTTQDGSCVDIHQLGDVHCTFYSLHQMLCMGGTFSHTQTRRGVRASHDHARCEVSVSGVRRGTDMSSTL